MLSISKSALSSMLAGAHSAYPNEFLALLEGKIKNGKIKVDKIVIPSGYFLSSGSAYWNEISLPPTTKVVGTFHSHPNGPSLQSRQDKFTGSKFGGAHLVLGWPFSLTNLKAYDEKGEEINFEII